MKIAIIHGPNLNMLGKRSKEHYGILTLDEICEMIIDKFPSVDFIFFQSNHEGKIIDFIQEVYVDGLVINAGAYTHTSIAIRDALEILSIPKIEVHLSNIYLREPFRHTNYIKDVVLKTFYGEKELSYLKGIQFLVEKIQEIK